jgi:hypothetical protein
MSNHTVRCKLRLNFKDISLPDRDEPDNLAIVSPTKVQFGMIWAGSTEKQLQSENAIFGRWTPNSSFVADIANAHALSFMIPGLDYYFDITLASTITEAHLKPLQEAVTNTEERLFSAEDSLSYVTPESEGILRVNLERNVANCREACLRARANLEGAVALYISQQSDNITPS